VHSVQIIYRILLMTEAQDFFRLGA